jgi:N-acetylmuramic acid 6-phosphate etherase
MILLGKVHQGLMVDVRISNEKLTRRGEHMLVQLTGCSDNDAHDALSRAEGSVKVAALLLHGCEFEEATKLLNRSGGQLRAALDLINDRA